MVRKRSNGAGSVYQRKDGKWVASLARDGRRVVRYASTQRAAHQRLAEMLVELDGRESSSLSAPEVTLEMWVQQWMRITAPRLRPSTVRSYEQVLDMVCDEIGHLPLVEVSPLNVTEALASLHEAGRGQRRIQMAYTVLKTCLREAVNLDLLSGNPLNRVRKPTRQPKERVYWNLHEVNRFVSTALNSHRKWAPLFVLLVTTGLRVSEALGLEWEDVDWRQETIAVRRAVVWSGKTRHVLPPKTKAGQRKVSLPRPAMTALERLSSIDRNFRADMPDVFGSDAPSKLLP